MRGQAVARQRGELAVRVLLEIGAQVGRVAASRTLSQNITSASVSTAFAAGPALVGIAASARSILANSGERTNLPTRFCTAGAKASAVCLHAVVAIRPLSN